MAGPRTDAQARQLMLGGKACTSDLFGLLFSSWVFGVLGILLPAHRLSIRTGWDSCAHVELFQNTYAVTNSEVSVGDVSLQFESRIRSSLNLKPKNPPQLHPKLLDNPRRVHCGADATSTCGSVQTIRKVVQSNDSCSQGFEASRVYLFLTGCSQ